MCPALDPEFTAIGRASGLGALHWWCGILSYLYEEDEDCEDVSETESNHPDFSSTRETDARSSSADAPAKAVTMIIKQSTGETLSS